MKRERKIFHVIIFAVFLISGCTITNKYEQYSGIVIDSETKQPIEGAAVLVEYNTTQFGLAGSVTYFADAQETLTDKNGEFRIPPFRIIKYRALSGWERYPGVRIFKPGYGCYPEHRDAVSSHNDPYRMTSVGEIPKWSLPPNQHVTIELPRLETKEEKLRNIGCRPVGVPDEAMRLFTKIINIENSNLGLQPYKEINK